MTSGESYHLRCTECGIESEDAPRKYDTCPKCHGDVRVVA